MPTVLLRGEDTSSLMALLGTLFFTNGENSHEPRASAQHATAPRPLHCA